MSDTSRTRWTRGVAVAAVSTTIALSAVVVTATGASASASQHHLSSRGRLGVCIAAGSGRHTVTVAGHGVRVTRSITAQAHRASCASLTLHHGAYTVSEHALAGQRVSRIAVSPGRAMTRRNLHGATVGVSLAARRSVRVLFAHTVDAPQTDPTPVGPPPTDPGYIEVCKAAGDSWVNGAVSVAVTDSLGAVTTEQVRVGQCTGPLQVQSGPVTVTETSPSPFVLGSVTTEPSSALLSSDPASGTASVDVAPSTDNSLESLVTLTNVTLVRHLKVCATLTSNSGDLISTGNSTLRFAVTYTAPGMAPSGPTYVTVTVDATDTQTCTLFPTLLPVGTQVQVTQDQIPNTDLTDVSVQPASQDAGSTSDTANLTIGAGPVTAADFTDMALGTVEICKALDDSNWADRSGDTGIYDGTPFTFGINGTAKVTVRAGACSPPQSVPAGTATIEEFATPNFQLVGFDAVGPNDHSRLVGNSTDNPVTVSTPWAGLTDQGVGNETLVTATNQIDVGRIKVCKILSDPPAGKTFDFTADYTVNGQDFTGAVSLTPTGQGTAGEACSALSFALPVINGDGSPVSVTVHEGPSPFPMDVNGHPTVEPTSITYSGNGSLLGSQVFQPGDTAAQDGTYYGTAQIGQGINVFTFTNSFVVDP